MVYTITSSHLITCEMLAQVALMFVDVHVVKEYIYCIYHGILHDIYHCIHHGIYSESVIYTMQYTMMHTRIYTFVYTESYLNSLLNSHSWDITRYWYWKITQQCSDISSFKSRQVVTKFSQGIPHPNILSAACTGRVYISMVYTMIYTIFLFCIYHGIYQRWYTPLLGWYIP
jgi:hypothetical protein